MKTVKIRSSFREAVSNPQGATRFNVVLIQEGLGNLNDRFFYTKESLMQAADSQLFDGKKCYANHPDKISEEILPERSVRDILGHFENVTYAQDEDGRGRLSADLVVIPDPSLTWARSLLSTAIDYAKKFAESEFIGLSINASGSASEVPLEEFMNRETDLPPSVLPKLQKALSEGIQTIRPVTALKDAVSVDLVTEAGAGGKIIRMLEQEKSRMKKKEAEKKEAEKKESEKKETEKKEAEAEKKEALPPAAGDGGDGAGVDHADAEQDKALFAQMVKQYLGDDMADNADAHEMAAHAYQACQSEGMEPHEAYEAAGKHLKMAMAIGKGMHEKKMKQAETESESESESEKKEAFGKPADHDGVDASAPASPAPKLKKKTETHYESAADLRAQLIAEKAENARLKEALKKYEITAYVEKKLKECGRPNSFTKKAREALGMPKSKEQFDREFKIFEAAFEGLSEESEDDSYALFVEKTQISPSDKSAESDSMSDCLN